jgi:hypothetical protein
VEHFIKDAISREIKLEIFHETGIEMFLENFLHHKRIFDHARKYANKAETFYEEFQYPFHEMRHIEWYTASFRFLVSFHTE